MVSCRFWPSEGGGPGFPKISMILCSDGNSYVMLVAPDLKRAMYLMMEMAMINAAKQFDD